MSGSFSHEAVLSAATKRATLAAGKMTPPVLYLTGLRCTPLDPVSNDIAQRVGLATPLNLLQTFIEGADIIEGDVLVVGGIEYPIKAVSNWMWKNTTSKHLVLEALKR